MDTARSSVSTASCVASEYQEHLRPSHNVSTRYGLILQGLPRRCEGGFQIPRIAVQPVPLQEESASRYGNPCSMGQSPWPSPATGWNRVTGAPAGGSLPPGPRQTTAGERARKAHPECVARNGSRTDAARKAFSAEAYRPRGPATPSSVRHGPGEQRHRDADPAGAARTAPAFESHGGPRAVPRSGFRQSTPAGSRGAARR